MELNLSRCDYVHVGSAFPNCVKVLPDITEDKVQEKLVIANREGLLQVVGWRKFEPVYICRAPLQGPITAVHLGGAIGTSKDKIFVASGNMVRGFTKKGKMFLEFDTNLAENIKNMYVMGGHLMVSGFNVYSQFEDCQDAGFYVSDENLNQILALPIEKVKTLIPVLACQDRTLRILDKAKLNYTVNLNSIPSALVLMNGDGGESGWDIVYGTSDGKFGLVTLGPVSAAKNHHSLHSIGSLLDTTKKSTMSKLLLNLKANQVTSTFTLRMGTSH